MEVVQIKNNVDESAPLLYFWEIHDPATGQSIGRYVGKAKGGSSRPTRHYERNVWRLLNNKGYRKNKPLAYRVIHHALKDAVLSGHMITLTFIRNVLPDEDINEAERDAIALFRCNLNR